MSLLGLVFIRLPKFKWPEYKYLKIFISCNLWPWDICSICPLSDFPEWFYDVTDPDTSHLIFEYDSRDIKRHLIVFKYAVWLYLIADSPKTDNSFLTRASLRTRGHAPLRVIPKSHNFWPAREIITGKRIFRICDNYILTIYRFLRILRETGHSTLQDTTVISKFCSDSIFSIKNIVAILNYFTIYTKIKMTLSSLNEVA